MDKLQTWGEMLNPINSVGEPDISGAGGLGKSGASSSPKEAPDDLLVNTRVRIIDVISEGEIGGFVDETLPGTCIYFDGIPLQNGDGSYNFDGVLYTLRTGSPDQEPVPGFSAVENEISVSALVEQALPVVRTITNEDVNAVRLKVGVGSFSTLNTENGNLNGAAVDYVIETQVGAAGWVEAVAGTIKGKTTSGYQRAHRVILPPDRPVQIRLRRVTIDAPTTNISDEIYFASYTEIIEAKLSMPNTAYVAIEFEAKTFGNRIPQRSYYVAGLHLLVPDNYDADARTYDEGTAWAGGMVAAPVSKTLGANPAWWLYTMLTAKRWGVGDRIDATAIDKWSLYGIAKYCDELVSDGYGGTEPRFTISGVYNTKENAVEVIRQIAAIFRSVVFWSTGTIVLSQDAPRDAVKLVTNANVKDGVFSYSSTARSARKSIVNMSGRDVTDQYKVKTLISYDDPELITRFGERVADITRSEVSSLGQLLREAKWIVETTRTEKESVSYTAGLDHASIRPGDRLQISDRHRVAYRYGGRLVNVNDDNVTLDAAVDFDAGETYTIAMATKTGGFITRDLMPGTDGILRDVMLDAGIAPDEVLPGAVFIINSLNLAGKYFTCVSNRREGQEYQISALEHNPNKYAAVESGLIVDVESSHLFPKVDQPEAPSNLTADVAYIDTSGSVKRPSILLGWQQLDDIPISEWLVQIRQPVLNAGWQDLTTTSRPTYEFLLSGELGDEIEFRILARAMLGRVSPWSTTLAFTPLPEDSPGDPTGYGVQPGITTLTPYWDPVELSNYRFTRVYVSETSDFVDATILDETAGSSTVLDNLPPLAQRWFWFETVVHAGGNDTSARVGPVTSTVVTAATKNVASGATSSGQVIVSVEDFDLTAGWGVWEEVGSISLIIDGDDLLAPERLFITAKMSGWYQSLTLPTNNTLSTIESHLKVQMILKRPGEADVLYYDPETPIMVQYFNNQMAYATLFAEAHPVQEFFMSKGIVYEAGDTLEFVFKLRKSRTGSTTTTYSIHVPDIYINVLEFIR